MTDKTKQPRDDPDETEGRRLYRGRANALARLQINLARRKPKLVAEQDAEK